MTYAIEFTRSARKEFNKLPAGAGKRIGRALIKLRDDPHKGSVRPMIGSRNWRLRVGDYRVIYDIQDNTLVILMLKVGHRKDVYKR